MPGSWRKMIYRAIKRPDGRIVVLDSDYMAETSRIVESEREMELAYENGWHTGPQEALAAFEALEDQKSTDAAIRAYDDRRVSPSAQAEVDAIERTTIEHLPAIPEARKRPRRDVTRLKEQAQ